METFSALLALCVGNSPVTGEFPSQRPMTRSFDVFFDRRLNKRSSKQSRHRWFKTPSCSLWRHCNGCIPWFVLGLEPPTFGFMPNALTIWAIRARHLRSHVFEYWLWRYRYFSCDQAALWMVFSVRLSVRPSVCPSVRLSHLFDYVPIIVSSWNFQELLPMTKVRSMQKVEARGQRPRSQRSKPNLTVSEL